MEYQLTPKELELENLLSRMTRSKLDVVVAIDGSGSVSNSQFEMMRSCVRQLITLLPFNEEQVDPPVRMAMLQFCEQSHLICNFEQSPGTLATATTGVLQRKGGTDASLALGTALSMFQKSPRMAERLTILLTDGDVANAQGVATKMMNDHQIYILVFGIGITFDVKVRAVGNKSIFIENFEELQSIFDRISCKGRDPPNVCLRSRGSINASVELICAAEWTKFEVQLFQENSNEWKTCATTTGRTCHIPDLEPGTVYLVRARAFLRAGGITKWSNEVENAKELKFRTIYEHPDAKTIKHPSLLSSLLQKMAQDVEDLEIPWLWKNQGVNAFNVLLIGRMGNGKTSYLNTASSSLRGQWRPINIAKNDIKTVTLNIGKFAINRNSTIKIWDTYGWSESNYTKEFDFLLGGNLRDGYQEGSDISADYYNPNPTVGDKVHAVIIVCTGTAVNTVSEMDRLRFFFERVTEKGIQPIVILTKMDTLPDAELEGHYENIYDVGVIDQAIETFCKHTRIDRAYVFPIINYQGPSNRNLVIEWLCLNVLTKAITQVQSNLLKYFRYGVQITEEGSMLPIASINLGQQAEMTTLSDVRNKLGAQLTSQLGEFRFLSVGQRDKKEIAVQDEAIIPVLNITSTVGSDLQQELDTLLVLYVRGTRPVQASSSTTTSTSGSSTAMVKFKVSIVNKDGKSLGLLQSITNESSLEQLRSRIQEELDDTTLGSGQFQFLSSTELPVPQHDEATLFVSDIVAVVGDRYIIKVNVEKLQKLSIVHYEGKRYGQIRVELQSSTPLADIRNYIQEQELPVPSSFRFLTKDDDPVTMKQEPTVQLMECKRVLKGKEGENYDALYISDC